MKMQLTIGTLAKHTGVTIEAIRHYQRIALLKEPEKPDHGYRLYPPEAIKRIRFIKRAQKFGFTLKEIGKLLTLDGPNCNKVKKMAIQRLLVLDKQIKELTDMQNNLSKLINDCESPNLSDQCAVLGAINDDNFPLF